MKVKSLWVLVIFFLMSCLGAVSMASATAINVSGTSNYSAYAAYFVLDGIVQPAPDVHAIPVTTPAGPWVGGTWITYSNPDQAWPMNAQTGNVPGTYFYLTMFDLTGLNPATAVIRGSWSADNGSTFLFNGDLVGTTGTTGYTGLTDFTLTSGFREGLNFFTFAVTNDPYGEYPYTNPTGLLVNIDHATAEPVPEPSTILLVGGGLAAVCLARRRAKS